jgi:pimeloyl-ACP methyl ester carboxylesterase
MTDPFNLSPAEIDAGNVRFPRSRAGQVIPLRLPCSETTDQTLWVIWRETLGLKATKRSLNLLDMGIGARRLMKLLNAIEDATGAVIAPTAALQLGTFEAFANAVREGGRPSRTPLILLKSADGGHGPPLYLISGGGGFILEQVEMGQAIVHDGPIYGLQLPGLDGSEEALGSIEAMAAYYLDYINLAHPGGAYYVVGYSFGGLVALEIARLLQTSGAHIGLIGLLESNVHERRWPLAAGRLAAIPDAPRHHPRPGVAGNAPGVGHRRTGQLPGQQREQDRPAAAARAYPGSALNGAQVCVLHRRPAAQPAAGSRPVHRRL